MAHPLNIPYETGDVIAISSMIKYKGKDVRFTSFKDKDSNVDLYELHQIGLTNIEGIEPELITINEKIVADSTGYFTEEEKAHAAKKLEWFKSLNN